MNTHLTPIATAVILIVSNLCAIAHAEDTGNADTSSTEEIVVTGIRASLNESLKQKRRSTSRIEVITAEDAGKMPDKNVADSLRHATGVNTASAAGGEGGFDENDRVSIRGTNPTLTLTLINGHAVSTGEWFAQVNNVGRSVSYALLPSELISKVTVHKSAQADLVDGGLAGTVDIETRRPLDFKQTFTAEGSLEAAYSDLARKTNTQLSGLAAWRNDGRTAGVLLQAFSQTRALRRDGQELLGYGVIGRQTHAAVVAAHPDLEGVAYPRLIGAALFEQERKRDGGAIEAQIKPTDDLTLGFSGMYSYLSATNINHNFMAYVETLLSNGVSPTSYEVKNGTLVSAAFPSGGSLPAILQETNYRPGANADSLYGNFTGEWKASDTLTISGQAGYTRGKGQTPGAVYFAGVMPDAAISYRMHGLDAPTSTAFSGVDVSSFTGTVTGFLVKSRVQAVDRESYGQLDARQTIDHGILDALKYGIRISTHDRRVEFPWLALPQDFNNLPAPPPWNGGTYPSDFGAGFGGGMPRVWKLTGPDLDEWASRNLVIDPATRRTGSEFDVKEGNRAAYVTADFAGDSWSANAGVRISRTAQETTVNVASASATGQLVNTPTLITRSYTDVLPSMNLKYDATKDLVLRSGLSRTVGRADYSALAGSVGLDDIVNRGFGGNPYLNPVRSNNLDLAAEWYFAPKSLLSVSAYYMDISSFITYGTSSGDYLNRLRNRVETYEIASPVNIPAKNRGVEIDYQQPLGRNFGVLANYTYAKGKADDGYELLGNSRNTYNLTGYYEDDRFNARLTYNYRSSYLVGLDRSFSQRMAALGAVSASFSYKYGEHLTFTLEALNLNNPVLKYYGNDDNQPRAFYSNGRQIYFGVRGKI